MLNIRKSRIALLERRKPLTKPIMTSSGLDWRHIDQRRPKTQYFIYQVCSWVLGVRFGSDAAKCYDWENGIIRIYDKDNNIVLEGSFAELLGKLRKNKWPNYPWS